MHRSIVALAIVAAFFIAPPSAVAQSGKGGGPKPKATAPTQSAPKVSPGAKSVAPKSPKTTAATAPKSPKTLSASTSKGPKTTTVSAPKGPKSSGAAVTKSAKSTAPKTPAGGTATAKSTKKATTTPTASEPTPTTTSPTPTTPPSDVTLTAVQQKLQKNTNLASKLQSRLPEGTNLMLAAEGFRNLGQFVAAVNVSNNLGIPFTELKTKMVDDGMSLGQSIQALKPTSSATIEAQRAEYDARTIIYESEQAPTTTTTTTPTKSKKRPGGSQ